MEKKQHLKLNPARLWLDQHLHCHQGKTGLSHCNDTKSLKVICQAFCHPALPARPGSCMESPESVPGTQHRAISLDEMSVAPLLLSVRSRHTDQLPSLWWTGATVMAEVLELEAQSVQGGGTIW